MSEKSLVDQTEEAMSDLIGRLARVQRISRVKAPGGALRLWREAYLEGIRTRIHEEAHQSIVSFVRVAQAYRAEIGAYNGHSRGWSQYEDQKLRKPIARLARLEGESRKAEALRRLKTPPNSGFFQMPNGGQVVKLTDWKVSPLYTTFEPSPSTKQYVAHEVLVAAGLYRKSPSQSPRT